MPKQSIILALLIVFAGLGFVVTGSPGAFILPAVLAGFYFFWRSERFSWTPILWVLGIVLLIAIAAYAYLLAYAQGWQY